MRRQPAAGDRAGTRRNRGRQRPDARRAGAGAARGLRVRRRRRPALGGRASPRIDAETLVTRHGRRLEPDRRSARVRRSGRRCCSPRDRACASPTSSIARSHLRRTSRRCAAGVRCTAASRSCSSRIPRWTPRAPRISRTTRPRAATPALAARAMVSAGRLCLRFFANDEALCAGAQGPAAGPSSCRAAARVCVTHRAARHHADRRTARRLAQRRAGVRGAGRAGARSRCAGARPARLPHGQLRALDARSVERRPRGDRCSRSA